MFYKDKKLFNLHEIDANKKNYKKELYGTKNSLKYFIGYNDDVIKPLKTLIVIRKCLLRLVIISY